MLVPRSPFLDLVLRPGFDQNDQAVWIDVELSFETLARPAESPLFRQILHHEDGPVQPYDAASIIVRTASGGLVLHARSNNDASIAEFYCKQHLRAQLLTVRYRALPRVGSEVCGPQVSLRQEGGGLSGAGMGFLLDVADNETDYDINIQWDLTAAPQGTRAVSTWGDAVDITLKDKPSILREAFFMLGPVQSYPHQPADFGMYWLSPPPFDAVAIAQTVEALLPKVCSLFDDPNMLFRVFTRRNSYVCNSGMGLYRAFVFAWNTIRNAPIDYTEFLIHEMVHNWPRLEISNPPTLQDLENSWFAEGIADYYAQMLQYRYGLTDEQKFVQTFNERISGYYTNPVRSIPNAEVPEKFWTPGRYNRVPYQRGFMYFVRLAYQLHQNRGQSLDNLIREMVRRRLHAEPHGIEVWLGLVGGELGPGAQHDLERMAAGETIVLAADCMDAFVPQSKWTLRRCDQEELDLGFPESCLSRSLYVVHGLDPYSRAADAGVCEGDHIVEHQTSMEEAERWCSCFKMTVRRDGQDVDLAWWPRSWNKVESYQLSPTGLPGLPQREREV